MPAPLFFQNNLTFVIQMLINVFPRIVFVRTFFFALKSCQLITGNKVKKTHKPRYCEKEKDKASKRSLSFDNNGLAKPSCETVALYGPFGFF
jgi:hypothetical protein